MNAKLFETADMLEVAIAILNKCVDTGSRVSE